MKIILALVLSVLLCGCGAEPTWEIVEDVQPVEPVAAAQQLYVSLPVEASTPTFQDDTAGEIYLCNGYTLTKQILPSGDLQSTVKTVTGLEKDQLELLQTIQEDAQRYDFVWTAATEEGLQVGRACILDDGNYHYVVSTMAEESRAGDLQETWLQIFDSCRLFPADFQFNTGS